MNYTQFFAKGGEIDTETIKSEMRRIFKISDQNKVEAIWQNAVQKYGSEEDVIIALYNTIGEDGSDESVQNAMMQIFNYTPMEESQYFKCGGKLQQLVTKFGKGGGVDCGCGGIKLETGGPAKVGEYNKEDFFNDRGAWETVHLPNGDVGYARNYRPRAFRFGPVTKNLNQVLITYDENGTPRASSREIKGFFNPNRVKLDTTYNTANNTRASKDFIDRMNFALEGVAPERPQSKQEGGTVELTPLPGHDVDTRLTRHQARDLAALNQGYNGEQFQYAMANAMNAARAMGLRGQEARQRAREMAAGISPTERSIVSAINTASTIASPAKITVSEQLVLPETQRTLDTLLAETNSGLARSLNRSRSLNNKSQQEARSLTDNINTLFNKKRPDIVVGPIKENFTVETSENQRPVSTISEEINNSGYYRSSPEEIARRNQRWNEYWNKPDNRPQYQTIDETYEATPGYSTGSGISFGQLLKNFLTRGATGYSGGAGYSKNNK